MYNYLKKMLKYKSKLQKGGNIYTLLGVCTAENRKIDMSEIDEEMPPLVSFNTGLIRNPNLHRSDFEKDKYKIFYTICQNLAESKMNSLKYTTIDPSLTNKQKNPKLEDPNYEGHISTLFSEIDQKYNNYFNFVYISSCYQQFFEDKTILTLNRITKPKAYLILKLGVPYENQINLIENYNFIGKMNNFDIYQKKI